MKMYADFSIVHSLVREFSYLPFFLSHALSSTDPLEKMKSIVSYSIASKHLLNSHKAALEPTIGETMHLIISDLSLYTECISSSPLIILFFGIGNNYNIQGYFEPVINVGPLTATINRGLHLTIKLNDKIRSVYKMNWPLTITKGIITGNRTINYTGFQKITDTRNKLYSKTFFDIKSKKGIFDKFSPNSKERFDLLKGFITQNKELIEDESLNAFKSDKIISYYEGFWTDNLMIEGKTTWTFEMYEPSRLNSGAQILPSDFTNRVDYINIKLNNLEQAGVEFDKIYQEQKADNKKRKEFNSKILKV